MFLVLQEKRNFVLEQGICIVSTRFQGSLIQQQQQQLIIICAQRFYNWLQRINDNKKEYRLAEITVGD